MDIIHAARTAAQASNRSADDSVILAAIKYAFLKLHIGSDIIYDPVDSIALEGNSGPYLQYAHARACAILAKVPLTHASHIEVPFDEGERLLLRQLSAYQTAVERAIVELSPHYICTYLYDTAQHFNRFYEQHKVIGDNREKQRLWLVRKYAAILQDGLSLLGIVAPQRM
jgi:arginyl-tRNA synthetase